MVGCARWLLGSRNALGHPTVDGTSGAPVEPYPREGLWHGLHGPFYLDKPLSLAELRSLQPRIASVFTALEEAHGKPLYLPFQLRSDGLRAAQGYLTKMPSDLALALPGLPDFADDLPSNLFTPAPELNERNPGQEYRVAQVSQQLERDPFSVDPAVVERALRSHSDLQNLLASRVEELDFDPRSPGPLDPPWDLLWLNNGTAWVAEVKSLTRANEDRQLRLGLGQVLIYRQRLLRTYQSVRAVLMVEWQPVDPDWHALCDSLNVMLLWPETATAELLKAG